MNKCSFNNGGCSHTCTNRAGNYSCSCPSNLVLAFDRHTCVTGPQSRFKCGGQIVTHSGSFTLPGYPTQAYPSNSYCVWVITLQDTSKAINLTFHGLFDIQPCFVSYLEVRDGDSPNSLLLGSYCGSVPPPTLSSSTNSLYIRFRSSENQTTSVGFNATFKAVELPEGDDNI